MKIGKNVLVQNRLGDFLLDTATASIIPSGKYPCEYTRSDIYTPHKLWAKSTLDSKYSNGGLHLKD